MSYTNVGIAAR